MGTEVTVAFLKYVLSQRQRDQTKTERGLTNKDAGWPENNNNNKKMQIFPFAGFVWLTNNSNENF